MALENFCHILACLLLAAGCLNVWTSFNGGNDVHMMGGLLLIWGAAMLWVALSVLEAVRR